MARVQVQFGGKNGRVYDLETNEDLVAIRTRDEGSIEDAPLSGASRRLLDVLEPVVRYRDAGVEVFHLRSGGQSVRDEVRATFTSEPAIRFAGRVLADPVFKPEVPITGDMPAAPSIKEPVLYSENIFIKFTKAVTAAKAKAAISAAGLKMKRSVEYLDHAYFVEAPEAPGSRCSAWRSTCCARTASSCVTRNCCGRGNCAARSRRSGISSRRRWAACP